MNLKILLSVLRSHAPRDPSDTTSHLQEAGKLLLRTEPIMLSGNVLQFSEEHAGPSRSQPVAPPPETRGMFVPRAAGSRPRAGLGRARKPGATQTTSSAQPPEQQGKKGQDDFRKMLG